VRGAVFAKEMQFLREFKRIGKVNWEPSLPVNTAWDLGISDSTAIWFVQLASNEARVIDYYEASGEALGHYVNVLKSKPYTWGKHIVPHDAQVRELGTGKSRLEILQSLGVQATVSPEPGTTRRDRGRAHVPEALLDRRRALQAGHRVPAELPPGRKHADG
jgi:phage terminase large subunit